MKCKEYGEEMAIGLMEGQMRTQHGQATEGIRIWAATLPGEEPRTYWIAFPTTGGPRNCLVEGCPGQTAMRMAMRVHFIQRHVQDNVVIFIREPPSTHGAPNATFWSLGVL